MTLAGHTARANASSPRRAALLRDLGRNTPLGIATMTAELTEYSMSFRGVVYGECPCQQNSLDVRGVCVITRDSV